MGFFFTFLQLLILFTCKSSKQTNSLSKITDNGVVVISTALSDTVKKKITQIGKGDKTQAVSLRIIDLKANIESGGIRIFIQKPTANQNTAVDSPEYVTSIFYDSNKEPVTYNVSLTNYINQNKLVQNEKKITFTFVFTTLETKTNLPIKLEIKGIEIY